MQIHLANSAGFCSGVKRAVRLALETARQNDIPVYMLGDIVHNEHVVQELDRAGIQVVSSLEQIESGVLLIRAHGAVPDIYKSAQHKGLKIIDATCPLVLEIHKFARQLDEEGYRVVVIGDHGHDEVIGIAGQAASSTIVASSEEAEQALQKRASRIGVVVQSTQDITNVQKILAVLASKCRELKFFNTICAPTTKHQQEIRELPRTHDIIIIIGSYTSANTCRMTSIAKALNARTYQVESANDVRPEWFERTDSVGVSAGASTPDAVIQQVMKRIWEIDGEDYHT
ncbi:4-hydroxy-3-methylbut-2-enyl diphosphate reductase [candidate division KSB3 bacterium]|uniref:4-hydroxy-3-methylbut-2-enyl diphosphate reductase n=1 Tax=candidate division KSB3 bacterium TaxID=2044937 RepID=A0A2G6KG37_9BACT|nr:MAG: 4-hydroxy-3-methylbut-2-enyl diphosphate reductase [candidate division KSB3 bacterium]